LELTLPYLEGIQKAKPISEGLEREMKRKRKKMKEGKYSDKDYVELLFKKKSVSSGSS